MSEGLTMVPCPLCGSARSKPLFEVRDWIFRVTGDRFVVRRCRECGCGYLSPRPDEKHLARYYPSEFYWSHEGGSDPLPWEAIVAARTSQLQAKAATLSELPAGRLLDIGAQKGEFLWYMQQRGWQVTGIEIENNVPNPMAMPIIYGDFLELDVEAGNYDAITAWAVLEHVCQPARFIEKAAHILKPGGRLVVLVTNFNSIQGRYFRADDYPRHLTLFTKGSVRRLARRSGLRVVRMWTDQKIFGGPLNGGLVYALKRLRGYSADEVFSEWRQIDDPMRFYGKWRGRPSTFVRYVSKLDRAVTLLPERILDALGYGFILTFVLEKPAHSNSSGRENS